MMVRPSHSNVHEFVAEENTCFFDICLPNYTADSLRRITYFKEVTGEAAAEANLSQIDAHKFVSSMNPSSFVDNTLDLSKKIQGLRILQYDSTPPKLPVDFEIAEVDYRGEMK